MRKIPGTNGAYRCEAAMGGRDIYDRAGHYLGRIERSGVRGWPWAIPSKNPLDAKTVAATLADAAGALAEQYAATRTN